MVFRFAGLSFISQDVRKFRLPLKEKFLAEVDGRAFVLRLIPSQDSDLIVKLLTSSGELVTAYARAGQKSRKRFGGAMEPLSYVDFRGTQKPDSEWIYLEELNLKKDFQVLRSDFDKLTGALFFLELCEHCAHPNLDNPQLFNLIGHALMALETSQDPKALSVQFIFKLLHLMGWLAHIDELSSIEEVQREYLKRLLALKIGALAEVPASQSNAQRLLDVGVKLYKTYSGVNQIRSQEFIQKSLG